MKSARFWDDCHGAIVRIKIAAGQTLHHSHGGRTDEGWSRESRIYSFDGETVTYEWCNDGVDCDGRLTRCGVCACPVEKLAAGYDDIENGAKFPAWKPLTESQRDYSAESANY
jgi:hypothetical protein